MRDHLAQVEDVKNDLPAGVPRDSEYRLLLQSEQFRQMEQFCSAFLARNERALNRYSNRWVRDPLHQWSRQWEYPYVLSRVEAAIPATRAGRVLDAGSGVTFFPYYLKALQPAAEIYCVDSDEKLEPIYRQINAGAEAVQFSRADLRSLDYPAEWFDVIYCISVLEHTADYPAIIDVFRRLLRPGGRLVITFDISLDGTRDIPVEKAAILLSSLADRLELAEDVSLDLAAYLSRPDLFTTHTAMHIDRTLLPWRLPALAYRLKALAEGKRFGAWPPLLTVFCLSLTKPENSGWSSTSAAPSEEVLT